MRSQALGTGKKLTPEWIGARQGFIDQKGKWMTRNQAWKVAEKAGQIKNHSGYCKGTLFSEDLY